MTNRNPKGKKSPNQHFSGAMLVCSECNMYKKDIRKKQLQQFRTAGGTPQFPNTGSKWRRCLTWTHLQLSVGRWFQENGRSEDIPTCQNKCGTLNEMHGTIWNLTFLLMYYVHGFFSVSADMYIYLEWLFDTRISVSKNEPKNPVEVVFFTMVRGNLMDNCSWTFLFLSEIPVLHRDLKQPKKLLVKVGDLVRSICLNYAQSKSALQDLQRLTIEPYHFKTWLMLTAQVLYS